jgi:response regulator RpfG family c-di-GMP phosphodiesterase
VAEIVLYQNKNFDGSGFPFNGVVGSAIPFGARLFRVLAVNGARKVQRVPVEK